MSEVIKRQQAFVEWLKSEGMYNPMESGDTMQKMHRVWERCGINEGHLEALGEEDGQV